MIDITKPNNELIKEMVRLQLEFDALQRLWMQAFEEANKDKIDELNRYRQVLLLKQS